MFSCSQISASKPGEGVEFLAFAGSLLIGGDEGLHPFGGNREDDVGMLGCDLAETSVFFVMIRPQLHMPGVTTIRRRLPGPRGRVFLVPM